ncbi:putative coagulation factor 5 8 type domain-containing protein [Phaeoacremonium minimum UCRPA7]|uniref:Putative coagulation factor 5 8 type domain-containing protein n=1 Tax=Phaeoacremonium minimum (strain UCR-PA7) TaxID=1286976 RepID=R8BVF7_PHAM7|nr:putative coagulation factor 5 8 type domain-containing protein [Phaeoacremonium minimum UCRPA7]EOO03310.1 putative coagulation factor 5 8 type domain-containing protein [Phaeoacremonium minimum UCRPA7]
MAHPPHVSAATYIVRYPTTSRSSVATTVFNLGDPGTERSSLVTPVIAPTLSESKSTAAVLVKSGDAAFITVATENATIYYTTDGSTPLSTNASQIYAAGTRITVSGSSGDKLVVKAIAVKSGQSSTVVTQTYQIASDPSQVPIFAPIINWTSGTYSQTSIAFQTNGIRIYCPSYMTNCYYTVDDLDPDPPMLGDNLGFGSRDQTIWQDPQDGLHYQITATDNLYVRVWQLNDDLTDVVPESEFDVFVGQSREAPALVRNGGASGKYVYIVTSTQSGWYPNQAMYKRATSIQAGFSLSRDSKSGYRDGTSLWSTLTPIGDASTFGSQSTWILNIGTDVSPSYVYIGDRYNVPSLAQSSYVFTPLYIDDNTAGENGVSGSGNMTLVFDPQPAIQVASNRIAQPPWRLLSLNKPVSATSSIALTAAQAAAGTYNYSASVANDGVNFDENAYDAVQQYYLPVTVPYFWQVDLQKSYALSWIGLSFRSVSGSDAVARYTASASKDNSTWTLLVDNTGNALPGYKSHMVSGRYRYVRIDVSSIYDVVHGTSAAWEAGLYEASVYGSC